jgi:hypothetical protein
LLFHIYYFIFVICYLLFNFKEIFMKKGNFFKHIVISCALAAILFGAGFLGCAMGDPDGNSDLNDKKGGFVAVEDIRGIVPAAIKETPINLGAAVVAPLNATNKTIVWSYTDAEAAIAGVTADDLAAGGTITPTAAGQLTLTATIVGGTTNGTTDYSTTFTITVTTPVTNLRLASHATGPSIPTSFKLRVEPL